jgi:hypothetical protein
MFAQIGNRPDIFYAVNNVANFTTKPSTMHYGVVRCVFKYLQGSVHLGLSYYGRHDANILQV